MEESLIFSLEKTCVNPKRYGRGGADSAQRSGDCLPFFTRAYYGHKIS